MRKITLHHGDAKDVLSTLPEASIHCCITSPPYFQQRDYGVDGQLGLEPSPDCLGWATGKVCGECYICKLLAVFQEVKRVLRSDGSMWVNIGDSYWNSTLIRQKSADAYLKKGDPGYDIYYAYAGGEVAGGKRRSTKHQNLKVKDLTLIPQRLALALQAQGWYIRNTATWYKSNGRVNNAKDRLGVRTEALIFAAKSPWHYYDIHALPANHKHDDLFFEPVGTHTEANYATMPATLVEKCLLLSTSNFGVCAECGAPFKRIAERDNSFPDVINTIGWEPTCDLTFSDDAGNYTCNCMVLDPFSGSGTTGLIAARHGRDAILIDIDPKCIQESKEIIENDAPLLNEVKVYDGVR